jgi:hypothetical protein
MKRKIQALGVTALIAGVTLVASAASAQTIEIPMSGIDYVTTEDLGDVFTDAEGITHYRGLIRTSEFVGQDADGVPITGTAEYEVNINVDLVTGDGDFRVKMASQITYGELTGAWRGTADFVLQGFFYSGPFNYSRGSGDFRGWHWRGISSGVFAGTEQYIEGAFYIPGGDKAAANEAETWSGVKDLFR